MIYICGLKGYKNMRKINNNGIINIGFPPIGEKLDIKYIDDDVALLITDIRKFEQAITVRVQMNVIVYCVEGQLQADIDNKTCLLTKHNVLVSNSKAIIANIMFSSNFQCKALLFTDKALQNLLRSDVVLWNKALYIDKKKMIYLSDHDMEHFSMYEKLIRDRVSKGGKINSTIMYSLFSAMLLELCETMMIESENFAANEHKLRSSELFYNFIELLSQETSKKHSVSFYAEKLCITPKYLSTICKQISDKSPLQWIIEYEIEEIKSYLKNTNLSCKQISDLMDFPNSSFFGRYVKKYIGVSPLEYRLNMRK